MPTLLVTGANRGIGLGLARHFAARGWTVLAACRNPAAADDLRALADASEGRVGLLAIDVADTASVEAAARSLDGTAIDILISNAGVYGPMPQTVATLDEAAWRAVLEVNTFGPVRVLKAFMPNLMRGERKLAATITSEMGSITRNTSGRSLYYRTSKAALNMAMHTAAYELDPKGIACIVIHPGWVQTEMGGPDALISVADSVNGIVAVLDRVGLAESGTFFNHDGQIYPW